MHKRDLTFSKPMMNAAGVLGFAPNVRDPLGWEDFGAFVTSPISLRPRPPAVDPEWIAFPGGWLLHTGLPNPGFKSTLRRYAPLWKRSDLPVIVHLMADRPEETVSMVRALEGVENVMAVELGFAPRLAGDLIVLAVEMCLGELPLIVCLPAEQVLGSGPPALSAGAAALSIAAPRGTLPGADGKPVSGRLYGPSLYPRSLELVQAAARLGLPVIAAGGLSMENSGAVLRQGALAFQLDTALWGNRPGGE